MLFIFENDEERRNTERYKGRWRLMTIVFTLCGVFFLPLFVISLVDYESLDNTVSMGFVSLISVLWASHNYSHYRQCERLLAGDKQSDEITALEKRLIQLIRTSE